jgi:hypothetical protein
MIRRIAALAAAGALAVAGVAWATQAAGAYTGRTSQHDGSISLTVKGGKVVRVSFVAGTGHGSGCTEAAAPLPKFPVTFKTHWAISKHGTFTGSASPRDREVFTLTGRVTGAKITGSFTDQIPLGQLTSHPDTCRSGKVTFTAVRASRASDARARSVSPKPGYWLGDSGAYTLTFKVAARGASVTSLSTDFRRPRRRRPLCSR